MTDETLLKVKPEKLCSSPPSVIKDGGTVCSLLSESSFGLQEVTPVQVPAQQRGDFIQVMTDETLLKVKPDKLRNLAPVFVQDGGTVTAGNSSMIADGAAALVLVSAERASELGLRVSPSSTTCVDICTMRVHNPPYL